MNVRFQSAAVSRREYEHPAVGARDALDDGESEPGAANLRTLATSHKWLLQPLYFRRWNAGPAIHDTHTSHSVHVSSLDQHLGARISQGVHNQIVERASD